MSLENTSLVQLQLRQAILIRIIDENPDDPRIVEPKRQLALIEEEIKSRVDEKKADKKEKSDEEDGLVVGLSTLELKSSSKMRG